MPHVLYLLKLYNMAFSLGNARYSRRQRNMNSTLSHIHSNTLVLVWSDLLHRQVHLKYTLGRALNFTIAIDNVNENIVLRKQNLLDLFHTPSSKLC